MEHLDSNIVVGILGISSDITERKQLEEILQKAAMFDELTGIPNRRLLLEHLDQALLRSKRTSHYGAVLFIDLDHFKQLNDTQGHYIGDQLLIKTAQQLNTLVRESDTVARLGGDEFIVLLEHLSHDAVEALKEANEIADKARMFLSSECLLGDIKYKGETSIGISFFLGDERSIEELLSEGDTRMYEEKKKKRKNWIELSI